MADPRGTNETGEIRRMRALENVTLTNPQTGEPILRSWCNVATQIHEGQDRQRRNRA
jgi:hypothetical protein